MKNKLLVFDFDGTLVQSHELIYDCLENAFQKRNIKLHSREKLRMTPSREFFRNYSMGPLATLNLIREVKSEMKKRSSELNLFLQVPELLRKLSIKWELHLHTSNTAAVVTEVLKKENLENIFSEVHADLGLFSKSKMLSRVANSIQWKEVYSIGDEDRDVLAAQKTGVKVIGVAWGLHDKSLLQLLNPTYFVNTFDQLDNLLQTIV